MVIIIIIIINFFITKKLKIIIITSSDGLRDGRRSRAANVFVTSLSFLTFYRIVFRDLYIIRRVVCSSCSVC